MEMTNSTTGKLGPLRAYSEERGIRDFAFRYAAMLRSTAERELRLWFTLGRPCPELGVAHNLDGVCYRCPPETPGYRAFWKEVGR